MSDLLILGTDTDAGKTTLAALWMAAFSDRYEYWKPLESGEADSNKVQRLVPSATVHPSLAHFTAAVAPLLAARNMGSNVPTAVRIASAKPQAAIRIRSLLIETFGSPLSPLNDDELQIVLVQRLALPCILVSSSAIGAIGRTLQCLTALAEYGVRPAAIVLVGQGDDFAVEQIVRHSMGIPVFAIAPPASWGAAGVAAAAREQLETLRAISATVDAPKSVASIPEILEHDRRFVWHPYTSLRDPDPPVVVVSAQDEFLHLADGRRVIDGISSWWTILHGHRYPPLMGALRDATERYDHVLFAGATHPPAVELAELLLRSAALSGGRVFYSDNGSTAVEVALKMAYQYWCHRGEMQRTLFVGFENGYHGDTFGAMAVGRDPVFFGRFEPLLFKAAIVPLDAERLDQLLRREHGHVAAVIVEPLVQGAGGMRMHTPAELGALADVARQHDVLLIADEVMTGGGRTGTLWAHQAAGIRPDLLCAGKTLAGGILTLAATLAAPHIIAAWDTDDRSRTFFHGHSFTAHPLACAIAAVNWTTLTVAPHPAPARMERFWNENLASLRELPYVRDLRIRGTIAAVEVDAAGGYLAEIGRRMRHACLQHDVFLRPLGSVLYAMPPFCTSEESLDRIATAMRAAVESAAP